MGYKRPTVTIKGKQMLVSRHAMEKHLGRKLASSELVHHKDKNPFNNSLDNLQIVTRAEHKKIHSEIGCGTRLQKYHHFDLDELLDLYGKKLTFAQIAIGKGCTEAKVRRALKPILGIKDLRKFRFRYKGKPYKERKTT